MGNRLYQIGGSFRSLSFEIKGDRCRISYLSLRGDRNVVIHITYRSARISTCGYNPTTDLQLAVTCILKHHVVFPVYGNFPFLRVHILLE